jgi:hypothetical protein
MSKNGTRTLLNRFVDAIDARGRRPVDVLRAGTQVSDPSPETGSGPDTGAVPVRHDGRAVETIARMSFNASDLSLLRDCVEKAMDDAPGILSQRWHQLKSMRTALDEAYHRLAAEQ